MEANNMKAMREASAPVPCDHVLTLDEAIAHAEECADNTPCGSQHRQLADWLKDLKTLKTSVSCGNTAAMREALKAVRMFLDGYTVNNLELRRMVDAALAEPPRNCDAGTVEEQTRRLRANCEKYKPTCKGCKALTDIQQENCWLKWAQMPYAPKEGSKE